MKPFRLKRHKTTANRMENLIKEKVYSTVAKLEAVCYMTKEPLSFENRTHGELRKLNPGDRWGDVLDCAWFNFKGKVPEDCKGKKIVLILDVGGEGCIFDADGNPVRGITSTCAYNEYYGKPMKRVVPFKQQAEGGEIIDIWVDCGNNDLFGNVVWTGGTAPVIGFQRADIAVCDEQMRALYYDYFVLNDLRKTLNDESPRYYSILYTLLDAERALYDFLPENVAAARKILAVELNKKGGTPSLEYSAIGHAHIDLAWLWPIRETRRKTTRTFATALELMERYPDYVFGASQPQQFKWIKDEHPHLYQRIKQAVKDGRFEPQGAMWVESDTNAPSGESLIRQILYGKRFFKDEFDKDIQTLWLPDAFGYSAALPQICAKSGVKYMLTNKIHWMNKYNGYTDFPYYTFIWKGLTDDSVIVHMPPEEDYNSTAAPHSVDQGTKNYTDKGRVKNALMLFGIGDGGGGPSTYHLEYLKRMKNLDGIVPVRQESSINFFKRLDGQTSKMNTYRGELYPPVHQGTFTTQSRNKYYNNRLERLLHSAELLLSISKLTKGSSFPKDELEKIWKETLLYQFHDILPGSSINRVYKETDTAYAVLETRLLQIVDNELGKARNTVFNPTGFVRGDVIENGGKWYGVTALPLGFTLIDPQKQIAAFNNKHSESGLENNKLTVKFDKEGRLVNLKRKGSKRNAVTEAGGNILNVYTDRGDAWDFDAEYYLTPHERFKISRVNSYTDGPYSIREQHFVYGNSKFIQKVKLKHDCEYLEFENFVDWRESQKMLRAEFYANITSETAVCGIQFGNIKRTTKSNTADEAIQFEVCAQKFVQLSEGDFSVALINDCKYGYRVKENLISLNLLRSSRFPDTDADTGEHRFSYAVYTAQGENNVEKLAYQFANPLCTAQSKDNFSFASSDKNNIIIETVKPGEDEKCYVMRLYENRGQLTDSRISLNSAFTKAYLCDLLENTVKEVPVKNNTIKLSFKGFEIHTIKLV